MPRIACTFLCALTVVQALLIQKPLRTDAGLCLAETPGGCVSCHMPRVPAMRAIVFTNHWIGVYPSADKLVPRQRTR